MLLRHPSPWIEWLGAAGMLGAGALLARALPLVPGSRRGRASLALCRPSPFRGGWHACAKRRERSAVRGTYAVSSPYRSSCSLRRCLDEAAAPFRLLAALVVACVCIAQSRSLQPNNAPPLPPLGPA